MKHKVRVDLTSTEHTDLGRGLCQMWYHTKLHEVIEDITGCPHHGGEHSCHIHAPVEEVLAWLDLFEETMKKKYYELEVVREKLKTNVRSISLKALRNKASVYELRPKIKKEVKAHASRMA